MSHLDSHASNPSETIDAERATSLRRWNLGLTVLHAAQAVAVVVLSSGFAITVTSSFPSGPPGSEPSAPEALFDVAVGPVIAVFLGLAALDHLLTATVLRGRYERWLARGINPVRWVEYSVSATLMLVLIGFYNGITGLTPIIALIGVNVSMILFGWLQESTNPPGRHDVTMLPFWFGCVAGVTPWIAIVVNVVGAGSDVPAFVYGIVVSLFVFFSSFAVNQYLQYRKIGPWKDYLFGEKAYLVLSLVAKSALAWQIFGGSLAG